MDNPISERMWQPMKQHRVRQRRHQPITVLDETASQQSNSSLELTENERQQSCRSFRLMQRLAGQVDWAEVSYDHRAPRRSATRAASDKNTLSGRRPEAITKSNRRQEARMISGQGATIVSLKRLHQRLVSLQPVNMVHLLLLLLLLAGGELGLGHKRNLVSSRSGNKPADAFQMEADERQMQLMRSSANVELTRRSQRLQRDAISATSLSEGPAAAPAPATALQPSAGAVTCGYPGSPAHASVTFNTSQVVVGTAASYTCDNGYELLGPPRRLCQANGTWSPVGIPFCGK